MNYNLTVNDFDKICRICIYYNEEHKLISITGVVKLLKACTSVEIPEIELDELPQNVCEECAKNLEKFYTFKEKCESSNDYLKQILCESKQKCNLLNDLDLSSTADLKDELNSDQDQAQNDRNTDSEDDFPLNDIIKREEIKREINRRKLRTTNNHRTRSKEKQQCDQCDRSFPYPYQLRKHQIVHTKEQYFPCDHCSKCFKTSQHLKRHKNRIHTENDNNIKLRRKCSKNSYQCDKCDKTFPFPYMVRNHQIVHSEEKLFSCEQCSKHFKKNIHLQQHNERCHNDLPRDVCNICGKTIKRMYMKRHIIHHQTNSSFPCTECDQDFNKRWRLEQHMKIAHNRILTVHKYLCTVCGKNVVSPKDLDNHMRVHTGERPYQCTMCEKNYKTSSCLNIHVRFTHKNERPFSCEICFKGFITRQKLERHKQTHSTSRSHVCLICGRLYGYESVLKSHMKLSHKVFTENK